MFHSFICGLVIHNALYQCKKIGKKLQVRCTNYFWGLQSFQTFIGPLFQIKLHKQSTVLLSGFQEELWNPLSKAVPGKFHRCGGHIKDNCLEDRTNFHRSLAWQIALIFTVLISSAIYHIAQRKSTGWRKHILYWILHTVERRYCMVQYNILRIA